MLQLGLMKILPNPLSPSRYLVNRPRITPSQLGG